jgi:hypothetical protein
LDRCTVFTFRVEVYLLTNVVSYIHTLQGKSMGGGKISLGKGNRAQEIGGGYNCTGVMWKNEEKRNGKGHSRLLSVKWDPSRGGGQWKYPYIPTTFVPYTLCP